jgi:sulfate transport system substrate-binding protein
VVLGFSILGDVMNESVFPAFARSWQQQSGEAVEVIASFVGSGTVTNQTIMGVPVDMVIVSLDLDAQRLVDAGRTSPDSWRSLPHAGVINRSPFVILVRAGNPKNIRDFGDLTAQGVRVVHPDPATSGAAMWSLAAEYGAGARASPADPQAGYKTLVGIWKNVVAKAASARSARTQFENGFGDALVTYEQEALAAVAEQPSQFEVVYPHSTILSEHRVVLIEPNIALHERERVHALAQFMWSEGAQRAFVAAGFRSVDDTLNAASPRLGEIVDPFLISDLGGWQRVKRDIVEGIWSARVLRELGQ